MKYLNKIKLARSLYTQNIGIINDENKKMLDVFYLIVMGASFILSILSFFVTDLSNSKILYLLFFTIVIIMYIFHLTFFRQLKKYSMLESKLLEFVSLIFTLLLDTVIRTESTACIFLVFLLVLPFIFIQKAPFSFIQTGFFYIAFVTLSIIFKQPKNFIVDILSSTLTLILSIYLMLTISMHRLTSLNNGRLLAHQIDIDELTKLSNRRKLNKYVNENRSFFEDADTDVSIIMMDIDFFKLYNDTYGHLQGDVCLEAIADVLKQVSIKYNCEFVRYGGEEFAAILIGKDYKYAAQLCKEVILHIYKLKIEHKSSNHNWVTISAGIASKKKNKTKTFSKLIDCADKALYVAKSNGKNCFAIYRNIVDNEVETF